MATGISIDLSGRRTVITGGAKGAGADMVDLFLRAGADVLAVDIDGEALDRLKAAHPSVDTIVANVAVGEEADRIVAAAGERLDVLVNNAGILDRLALVDEVTEDEWRRVFDVNLTGPYLLCNRVVPKMVAQGGGVIVNIASLAGVRGGRAGAAYTASKHGLVGLSANIAATFGNQGVRCVALCPGGMTTGMDRGGVVSERGSKLVGRDRDLNATGPASEVAGVALFLASDLAIRINGSVVMADNGAVAF